MALLDPRPRKQDPPRPVRQAVHHPDRPLRATVAWIGDHGGEGNRVQSFELLGRLLILGGEACPPEIGSRFATERREVWNTYGPTEATVVSCAAKLTGDATVRIGLPLDGWDLAVVNDAGDSVGPGESGELIIGGIGLARYLDPAKDEAIRAFIDERKASMPDATY